jgi:hypothetical protein
MRCFCSFWCSNCAELHAKTHIFCNINRVTSFVFKYFSASFPLFFIFCISLACRLTGTIPIGPPHAWCGGHQRQNVRITDHLYRLSRLDGVVKQKIGRVPKLFGSAIIQVRPARTNLLGVVHLPDCRLIGNWPPGYCPSGRLIAKCALVDAKAFCGNSCVLASPQAHQLPTNIRWPTECPPARPIGRYSLARKR